jgi:putative SOS response-associated peptidase YedK
VFDWRLTCSHCRGRVHNRHELLNLEVTVGIAPDRPADAFYEWQRRTGADGRPAGKLPYAIRRRDGKPMAFAGIWEVWRDQDDPEVDPLRTCAIVTTAANDLMAPIHDRMPVVLAERDWSVWLDARADLATVRTLLVPAPSEWFEAFPVSTLVNSVENDGPELLRPLPPPPTA